MQSSLSDLKNVSNRAGALRRRLKDMRVSDLIKDKRRLVEVPYTATLADTMNALTANRILAAPVAAPPGHWIGAGGSMILESDKQTGAARKHYIGMVTMLDVLCHMAGNHVDAVAVSKEEDFERLMQVPVSSIIGHCIESLSLWTLNNNTSIVDCMEVFSKGVHRALVPVDGQADNVAGVELVESASSYRMATQMDLIKFLKLHEDELTGVLSRPVRQIGAVSDIVFGVTDKAKVVDAIKCMYRGSLNAVPILDPRDYGDIDHSQLINGRDGKIVGTFSASDLRGCSLSILCSGMNLTVVEFLKKLSETPQHEASGRRDPTREPVTCLPESSLGEVVEKAINNDVHRVWVIDDQGSVTGVVSLTDIIRGTRVWIISQEA